MRAIRVDLPPAERDRLAKLLGMLGSDHDGEVLNAARLEVSEFLCVRLGQSHPPLGERL